MLLKNNDFTNGSQQEIISDVAAKNIPNDKHI